MEENNAGGQNNPSPISQKGIVWGLVIVILILTVVLAYALVAKKAEAPAVLPQSAVPVPGNKSADEASAEQVSQVEPIESPAANAIEEKKKEEAEKYAGWMTYKSDKYKYEIKFPSGTTIGEMMQNDIGMSPDSGMTFEEAYAKVTSQVCVELKAKKGTIYISAPVNKGFVYAICGRTGVGSETKITKSSEKININGKEYMMDISHFSDPGGSSIEAGIVLDDDTQFYVSSGNDAGWAEMKKMLESFKKIK